VAGKIEPLFADLSPVLAAVPVLAGFRGVPLREFAFVFGAVALAGWDGPPAFGAGAQDHAGTGSASTDLRLSSSLVCAAGSRQLAQAVNMSVGWLVSLSYLKT
jgi:hypothetical protein